MATDIIFAGTNDGEMRCNDATYATARSGGGTFAVSTAATSSAVGQELFAGQSYCYESAFDFDTSTVGTDIVSAATLSLWGSSTATGGTSSFTHQARLSDWGATLTSADWIAGASLSGLTLLAHLAQASVSNGTYNDFVDDAMAANVNRSGNTRMIVHTTRLANGDAPTGTEYEKFSNADTAGTSNDPKLTITHAPVVLDPMGMAGIFGL